LLPKPGFDGLTQITLTPLELLDRLAKFIPPPRRHLHRYHGVFAPHAKLRAAVAQRAGQTVTRWGDPPAREDLAERMREGLSLKTLLPPALPESTEPPQAGPIRDPPAAAPAWAEGTDDSDAFALEPDTQHMPDYENQRQDVDR